jgi:hypothetical protein
MATPQVEAALRRMHLEPVTPSASPKSAGNETSTPRICIDQVETTVVTMHSTTTFESPSLDANEVQNNTETHHAPSYVLTASPPQMHQHDRHKNDNIIKESGTSSKAKGGRRDSTLDSMSGAESEVGRGPPLGLRRSFTFFQQHEDAVVQSSMVHSTHRSAQPRYESGDDPLSSVVSCGMVSCSLLH